MHPGCAALCWQHTRMFLVTVYKGTKYGAFCVDTLPKLRWSKQQQNTCQPERGSAFARYSNLPIATRCTSRCIIFNLPSATLYMRLLLFRLFRLSLRPRSCCVSSRLMCVVFLRSGTRTCSQGHLSFLNPKTKSKVVSYALNKVSHWESNSTGIKFAIIQVHCLINVLLLLALHT